MDACGCTDDRCIGYHHDPREDCGCLPVLLDSYLAARTQRPRPAGPYETERDAMHDSLWHRAGRDGSMTRANRADLADAAQDLELGAHDRRILDWLAGYEPSTVAVICGLIRRARAEDGAR